MLTQHVLLPLVYRFWRVVYVGRTPDFIIFADAHHTSLPVSMEHIHRELERRGFALIDVFCDYEAMSAKETFTSAAKFMRLYVRASHVFICDNFLPVSSCRKRRETKVVQLWHACGALKKTGYDAPDDVPPHYIGNVYKNYDLVTVSAPYSVPAFTGGMRQKEGVVRATGVSRTDVYFDREWRENCRKRFIEDHPEAAAKKVIVWAPTFRGNAANPSGAGFEEIRALEESLGDEYIIIKKMHPHMEKAFPLSNSRIPTEELLAAADLLITDYSSVIFDSALLDTPFVLFAPDLDEYREQRGFYVEYENMSPWLAESGGELKEQVLKALADPYSSVWLAGFRDRYLCACDGNATNRILSLVELGYYRTRE